MRLTAAYKLLHHVFILSGLIATWEALPPLNRTGEKMKRLTLTLIASALLAALLGGCVVDPWGGYGYGGYHGGYHHGGYYGGGGYYGR